jgi:hypothetical protein
VNSPYVIALAAAFGESLRTRGREYFDLGRVERIDVAERAASAHVRGSRLYVVRIVDYRDASRCKMHCTCSFGARAYPCIHMWATVLAIDAVERGPTDAPRRLQGPLQLDEAEANAASAASQPPTRLPPPAPAPPKWLSRVARLRRSHRRPRRCRRWSSTGSSSVATTPRRFPSRPSFACPGNTAPTGSRGC